MRSSCLVLAGLCACAASEPVPAGAPPPRPSEAAIPVPREYAAAYVLTWADQRIGDAAESLARAGDGFELVRRERIAIRRGDGEVQLRTEIRVELDDDLRARRVTVTRDSGGSRITGEARRGEDGEWRVQFGDEPARAIDGATVPLELLPAFLAAGAEPRFEGQVMLPGYGFATAELYARPASGDPRRVVVALVVPAGVLRQELVFDERGLVRIDAPGAVEARRVEPALIAEAFEPPELVDSVSISVSGRAPERADIVRLVLDGVTAPEPPALPAQHVRVVDGRWEVTLAPGFNSEAVADHVAALATTAPPDQAMAALAAAIVSESGARAPMQEIAALARYTDRLIEDDLAVASADARTAFALGRGDCTAHATVFAAFAAARGFEVRLVTGYRLTPADDGHRLVRHRWAIARVDDLWIAVDPTYGEAPAAALDLGLAIHGASAAEIALIDELTFAGFRTTTAAFR